MRICASHANIFDVDAQTIGTNLRHFGIEALTHFGSAMVDADRAVHVDVEQSTALIQHGGREANAKLQGHQSQATLAALVDFVEGIDAVATLAVLGFRRHLVDDFVAHPIGNGLTILRGHGGWIARDCGIFVDIKQANIQRIFANVVGNLLNDCFNAKHALRATKTAERCSALRVGFAAVADEFQVGNVVAVVDVQTGTVIDGARVVGAVTAARHERDVGAQNAAFIVITHFVVDAEIVTLARDHHVVIAVHAQLDGALQFECGQSSALAENAGVAFFATKATPHATTNNFHVVGAEVQGRSGFTLVAIWVLSGAIQSELTIFTRHGIRNLAFHVELFLLASFGTALDFARRIGNGFSGIAACNAFGGHDKTLRRHGFVNGQDGCKFFDQHFGFVCSFAGIQHFACYHHRYGLS